MMPSSFGEHWPPYPHYAQVRSGERKHVLSFVLLYWSFGNSPAVSIGRLPEALCSCSCSWADRYQKPHNAICFHYDGTFHHPCLRAMNLGKEGEEGSSGYVSKVTRAQAVPNSCFPSKTWELLLLLEYFPGGGVCVGNLIPNHVKKRGS